MEATFGIQYRKSGMKYILSEETKREVEETRRKRLKELSELPIAARVRMLINRIRELVTNGTSDDFSDRV